MKAYRGKAPKPHNYLLKLARLQETGGIPLSAGLHDVTIAHDAWCGIDKGKRCDCDPDITVKTLWSTRPQG